MNEGTQEGHFVVEVEAPPESSGTAGHADFQEIPDLDEDFRPANIPVKTFKKLTSSESSF